MRTVKTPGRVLTAPTIIAIVGAIIITSHIAWYAIIHLRHEKLYLMLRPPLAGNVLDVGCWNGNSASRMLQKQESSEPPDAVNHIDGIHGIDPHLPDKVSIPAESFDGVNIPAKDKQYHAALASFILHHAESKHDTIALLKEMKRVSHRVVVAEDNINAMPSWAITIVLHEIMRWVLGMGYRIDGFCTSAEWRRIFQDECGFRVVAQQDFSSCMLFFPFLRHTVYILEDAANDDAAHLLPPVAEIYQNNSNRFDMIDMLNATFVCGLVSMMVWFTSYFC